MSRACHLFFAHLICGNILMYSTNKETTIECRVYVMGNHSQNQIPLDNYLIVTLVVLIHMHLVARLRDMKCNDMDKPKD